MPNLITRVRIHCFIYRTKRCIIEFTDTHFRCIGNIKFMVSEYYPTGRKKREKSEKKTNIISVEKTYISEEKNCVNIQCDEFKLDFLNFFINRGSHREANE